MFTIEDIYSDIKNGATLDRIHSKYGGFRIYIAKRRENYKEDLISEFNGYNFKDLAWKYGLSESHVREIVKGADHFDTPSLFD